MKTYCPLGSRVWARREGDWVLYLDINWIDISLVCSKAEIVKIDAGMAALESRSLIGYLS